jgi:hypothetical protein
MLFADTKEFEKQLAALRRSLMLVRNETTLKWVELLEKYRYTEYFNGRFANEN